MEQQVFDFLDYLIKEHGRSANTIAAYRNDLTQFVEFLAEHSQLAVNTWSCLGAQTLEEYLSFLRSHPNEYSSATVARKLAAVKRFCEFLHEQEFIESNFAKAIRLPKVTKTPPLAVRTDEINRLLAEPLKHRAPQALRDKALLETLYATGMRVSELVDLDVSDVDLATGSIHCDADGKHQRVVALAGQAATSLATYLGQGREQLVVSRNEPALFLNHRGQRLTRQGLWLIIKRYVQQIGIQSPVTPHTLRHSFAAHLISAGAALREVKERLGYAHLSSTQVYQQIANGVTNELVIDGRPTVSVNGKL
ncbi:MAG TPA: tyrosine-type recombinase/integrase [Caldilineaceae bacterium]|nr:tyrosine-type recombinase/integrase [Caldilineaceae bacterium]